MATPSRRQPSTNTLLSVLMEGDVLVGEVAATERPRSMHQDGQTQATLPGSRINPLPHGAAGQGPAGRWHNFTDYIQTAEHLKWPPFLVQAALNYAADFKDEIEAALEDNASYDLHRLTRMLSNIEVFRAGESLELADPSSPDAGGEEAGSGAARPAG